MYSMYDRPGATVDAGRHRKGMPPRPMNISARDRYNEMLLNYNPDEDPRSSGALGPGREEEEMNWWEMPGMDDESFMRHKWNIPPPNQRPSETGYGDDRSGLLGGLLGYTGPQDYRVNVPQVENDMYENPEWFGGSSGSNVYSEPNFRRPPEGY